VNHRSSTFRTPALGLILPGRSITVTIEKPLQAHEIPVVITRQPGAILIRNVTPTSAVVENKGVMPVFYVLIVVPRSLMRLAAVPWRDVLRFLNTKVGLATVAEKIGQLFLKEPSP